MPRNSFAKVFSQKSIADAWKALHTKSRPQSRNSTGIDGVSINDFASDQQANLNRIYRQIHEKDFAFESLKPVLIPKANGKDRLICVPTVRDRVLQKCLLDFLSKKYRSTIDNGISFGFVPEKSVKQAANNACQLRRHRPWVFKTDISSFFDSVDRDILRKKVRAIVKERSLYPIIDGVISSEIKNVMKAESQRITKIGIKRGVGIRQGMPLSPFLANIMLSSFDGEVIRKEWKCVRYADDLIFFCKSKSECELIAAECKTILSRLNLDIPDIGPESKSVICGPDQSVDFLGLSLSLNDGTDEYGIIISKKQRQKIRDELLKLSSVSELVNRKIYLRDIGGVIRSKIAGYMAAYDVCDDVSYLEMELSSIETKILTRIYEDGLGINIKALGPAAKKFLSI